jgi:hypothetical protein
MIPKKTIEVVGPSTIAGALRFKAHKYYAIEGNALNDLCVLAVRFNSKWDDPDETRDWQNRLNLILDTARRNGKQHRRNAQEAAELVTRAFLHNVSPGKPAVITAKQALAIAEALAQEPNA